MARTYVKICGITRPEDALAAVAAGADALGLVFWPGSRRHVQPQAASEIVGVVAPLVTVVGLFVNADPRQVREVLRQVPLDVLQFHGDEAAADCAGFARRWIKAVHAEAGFDLARLEQQFAGASALLVDSAAPGHYGGSGETFDWSRLPARRGKPLLLAGGLHAGNVARAVREVRPFAVDVSSGVESTPGIKDSQAMADFVAQVRLTDTSA